MNLTIESILSEVREYSLPKHAVNNVKIPYTILGIGSGRIILELDSETVLKLSVSQMGDHQNETESLVWDNASKQAQNYLAPVIAVADDYTWIQMKQVSNPTDTYDAFGTPEETEVRDILAEYGIILNEVEVGDYEDRTVACDYGNCQGF